MRHGSNGIHGNVLATRRRCIALSRSDTAIKLSWRPGLCDAFPSAQGGLSDQPGTSSHHNIGILNSFSRSKGSQPLTVMAACGAPIPRLSEKTTKMKKTTLAATALLASSVGIQAHAQNSVTLYGIIDDSIQYAHNAGGQSTQISMVAGQLSGSRWGLKGSEDLGGGLSAVFRLENGFNAATGALGQGGRMFGRQAYVGLSSATYGAFTLGRQYDALHDLVLPVQGNNFLEYFSAPGDVDSGDGTIRFDNTAKWTSPVWSGLQFMGTYSLGGVAGSPGSGTSWGSGVAYNSGPVHAAAAYLHIDNGNATTSTRGTTTSGSLFGSVVNSAYSTARSINITRVAGNYVMGPFTVGGYYSYSEYVPDAASKYRGNEHYNNGSVFALWQVSVPVQIELGYDYMKSGGNSSATYNQANLAADYLLSKRTDLYAIVAYGHASGKNGLGNAQAVIADTVVAAGNASQELVILGIRHRF